MQKRSVVLALLCATVSGSAVGAQSLYYVRRTGHYGQFGLGSGNFTLACNTGCLGNQQSGSDFTFELGHNFARGGGHAPARVRLELGFHYQHHKDLQDRMSFATAVSGGVAAYLVGNLYVRGGGMYGVPNVQDSTGSYLGRGAGVLVGAGYDVVLGRRFALTPYVSYSTASMPKIDMPIGGTTHGTFRALNFGVTASWVSGTWWCVDAAGQQVKVDRKHRDNAEQCLDQVARQLGRGR